MVWLIHTTFPKGKRIVIVMKNGDVHIDKYVDKKKGNYVFFENLGRLRVKDIKSLTIYRGPHQVGTPPS